MPEDAEVKMEVGRAVGRAVGEVQKDRGIESILVRVQREGTEVHGCTRTTATNNIGALGNWSLVSSS